MITRLRSGREMELRAFSLNDMRRYGWSDSLGMSGLGEKEMRGVPAIHRAARIRSEALASLDLKCYSGEGADRMERPNVPPAVLFAGTPNEYQTRFGFWETVGESLAYRNKAAIWKTVDPISGRVLEWYALHPDQVECKGDSYRVTVRDGYVDPVGRGPAEYVVDDSTLLFIRGHGQGGMIDPPTPIQVFRSALAGPVGRQRHEARMWRRGTALQVAIEFPQGVSAAQADEWRESWRSNYEGTEGETTAVIGGGAQIKPIGMTAADAQFVELSKLTVDDASRIMGVPGRLLGLSAEFNKNVPLEQDLAEWLRFGLQPELYRIEAALKADTELFPAGSQTYPLFNTETFVRGDVQTEDAIAHARIQDGRLTVNEWRAMNNLDPLPGGDMPQITPVGGAPNSSPAQMNGDQMPAMNGNAA